MENLESLIHNVLLKKYKYIKLVKVDSNNKYLDKPCYRRIIRSSNSSVVSISNLINQKWEITRTYPSDNYVLINDGYVEKITHDKYGTSQIEVTFLKDLPWLKSATKNI